MLWGVIGRNSNRPRATTPVRRLFSCCRCFQRRRTRCTNDRSRACTPVRRLFPQPPCLCWVCRVRVTARLNRSRCNCSIPSPGSRHCLGSRRLTTSVSAALLLELRDVRHAGQGARTHRFCRVPDWVPRRKRRRCHIQLTPKNTSEV